MGTFLGHGSTITFSSGFLANITSVALTGVERAAVPATTFGTTGGKDYVPGDLVEGGELVVEMHHDAAATPPIENDPETITITWPTTPAETIAFSGFMTGYEINAVDEEKVRATARIKVKEGITW